MYQNAAILAAFLLIYSAVAGRVERSLISGPIVFTGVGFILGPDGLDVLRINISGEGLRLLCRGAGGGRQRLYRVFCRWTAAERAWREPQERFAAWRRAYGRGVGDTDVGGVRGHRGR